MDVCFTPVMAESSPEVGDMYANMYTSQKTKSEGKLEAQHIGFNNYWRHKKVWLESFWPFSGDPVTALDFQDQVS